MSKDLFFAMQQESIAQAVEEIEQGNIEGFETYAFLDRIEKTAKEAKAQIKDVVIEASKNHLEGNSKEFKKGNVKFTFKNGSTRYSFKNIKKHQEKAKELKAIEEESKQAFLAKQKNMLVANQDGEEIELPEVSYTADSITVNFID